jgi:hypothetical protein
MEPMMRSLFCLFVVMIGNDAFAQDIPWDWQLTGPFDLTRDVGAISLDPVDHDKAAIMALNERGVKTICYTSIGTLEDWRDDVDSFPDFVVGGTYDEFSDDRFLDIRQIDVLIPIMAARFQACKDNGFVAIEADNQDIYQLNSGMQITTADTVAYLTALADIAHGMELQIGQKNVPDLTPDLVGTMDFVIAEGCYKYDWCDEILVYAQVGKPLYAAEILDDGVDPPTACRYGAARGIQFIFKDSDLSAQLQYCP